MTRIYLDHNASTPLRPEVAETMRQLLEDGFGNPSSDHWAGAPARATVETARAQVAERIGAETDEIIFTSGGSEANNHALKGAWFARDRAKSHIISSTIEHPAVIQPLRFLERLGARITLVPVDKHGLASASDIARALTPDTLLVSLMHANNEVGTIQPITECAALAHEHGALFHTDAAQSLGKIPVSVDELGCDLLSIAGHKLGAPKGIGALYARRGVRLETLVHGAGHESGRRAGTESALLTAALGQACAVAVPTPDVEANCRQFWQSLREHFGQGIILNGHPELRLPNTLNVSFPGHSGAAILSRLAGVAASTGSACHTGTVSISPVLAAMGVDPHVAMGAIRFSLGRETTPDEIESVVAGLIAALG